MLTPAEQADVLKSIANVQAVVAGQLNDHRSQTFVVSFVANLQRGVDDVVRAATERGVRLDCKAGCSHCCSFRVEALEPEIFRIAREIRQRPAAEIAQVIERLKGYVARAQGVLAQDHRIECAFLKDNLCSIYAVRPAACRKAHSLNVEQCKVPGADIPGSLEITLKSEVLMKGTANGYSQINLPASGHELGRAVLLVLNDDTAEARWFDGEAVFDVVGESP
jgi:Fe-S-cluster containining protein